MKEYFLYTTIFILLLMKLGAQDLERLNKKDVLKISGGLNVSSVSFYSTDTSSRRQPFSYFVNGNITGDLAGIVLPFTFNFSNNRLDYSQPASIQSFNPSYKWARAYIGVTSMNFSQYTMSGHLFTGGGVELSPGAFRFSAVYGKFKNAAQYDAENESGVVSYKRMGWGLMTGYEKNGHGMKIIVFSAKDDAGSLTFVPVKSGIAPMYNTVASISGKTVFFKKVNLDLEYALSGLTRNTESPVEAAPVKNQLPLLFRANATSQFFSAYKGSLSYRYKVWGISLNHERIDPDYQTLGAYFFNNDLENYTIASNLSLLNGKLTLAGSTGLQRNNLNKEKLNTSKRWVGSFSLGCTPAKKLNLNASYSNFTSYTRQMPQINPFYNNVLDTMNIYQVSQNCMFSASQSFNDSYKQTLSATASYMLSTQRQFSGAAASANPFSVMQNPSEVINGNLSHNITFPSLKITVTTLLNANHSKTEQIKTLFCGPGLNLSEPLLKGRLRLGLGSVYNRIYFNGTIVNEVFNHRLTASYSPEMKNKKAGKFSFSFSAVYLQKLNGNRGLPDVSEFTGNTGLSYNF